MLDIDFNNDENWNDEEFEYENIEYGFSSMYSMYYDLKSNQITREGIKEMKKLKKYINVSYGNTQTI